MYSLNDKKMKIRYRILQMLAVFFIAAGSFAFTMKQMQLPESDIYWHSQQACTINGIKSMFNTISYPLYHVIVNFLYKIMGISLNYCAGIVVIACNLLTYCIIFFYLDFICREKDIRIREYGIGFTLILMLVQAIYMPWFNKNVYLGQGSINIYHNPTYLIVKPIGIIIFLLICYIYIKNEKHIAFKKEWWFLAGLSVLANLAKPSFFYVFIPGLGLYMLMDMCISGYKKFSLHFQVACAFIPAALVALFQAMASLTTGIEIEWMGVWKIFSPNPYISILLFIAFPLYVLLLSIRIWDVGTKISLSVFFAGFLEAAILAEKGERRWHGNFFWGYYLGGALLWLEAVKIFILWHAERNKSRGNNIRLIVGWILLILHVCSGIRYLYTNGAFNPAISGLYYLYKLIF